jgi:hypothetical protein
LETVKMFLEGDSKMEARRRKQKVSLL